jgi:uncharacterized protein YyaL (SSP411 family)
MSNRLQRETSPYLRQHASHPVDWYPWGEEALARARTENKPILLSIGYSSCHWCHVMAHECFEDTGIATLMNARFINIKVDREERPDLDQIYQTAHQMLARRSGGWPLTVVLTPEQVPFFAGTYFPKLPRPGLPAFAELLDWLADAWHEKRAEIEAQNSQLLAALQHVQAHDGEPGPLDDTPIDACLAALRDDFDPRHGGFSGAPKFPHPTDLRFALEHGDDALRDAAHFTLTQMAAGGLMDQLGGGFYRYSVDERWEIPHFEKMLYDNGQLLSLYAYAWRQRPDPRYLQAAAGIAEWVQREMCAPHGAFYAALDADSEHEEGKYYVWTAADFDTLLSPQDAMLAKRIYGVDRPANFEGHWHLTARVDPQSIDPACEAGAGTAPETLTRIRERLLNSRRQRIPPGRDDKVLTAWNALLIKGLAEAGAAFGRTDWTQMACRAIDALHARVWQAGRLYASWQGDTARFPAYLDDYAFLLDALIHLMQTEFRNDDLAWAKQLADRLITDFPATGGGFHFTAANHERLIQRPFPVYDHATPSGNAVAASALLTLGQWLGREDYLAAASQTLERLMPLLRRQPRASSTALSALCELLAPTPRVILRGPAERLSTWATTWQKHWQRGQLLTLPNDIVVIDPALDKPQSDLPCAWLCLANHCLAPVCGESAMTALLRQHDCLGPSGSK